MNRTITSSNANGRTIVVMELVSIKKRSRSSEGKHTRMRRLCLKKKFGHNLLIRGGLQAYALTLLLLGFKCTWYKIKSRDMSDKGKDYVFYNKPYMPSAGLHGSLHMALMCAFSLSLILP